MKTAAQLLASHARDIIERISSKPAIKISAHVAEWNTGVEQASLTGIYDFPSDYKRKAHLVQDLVRCAEQLEAKAAEALVEVPAVSAAEAMQIAFFGANDYVARRNLVEQAHVEALEINEGIDAIVSYAGNTSPVQIDGDINWIFDAAVCVWNRQRTHVSPVTTPVFTLIEPVCTTPVNFEYDNLVKTVEDSTHLMKVRLFCEVTQQSEQMAELMLSRSDGFLLGAIKMFSGGTGGNPDAS